jgi:hypothetical protein
MSCSNIDTCGCGHQHSAKCSFYYGDTLSCIGVAYGTDLEQALIDINTAVCALTPSGSITVVDSCDTNIDVTSAVVGQTTTYTVCLSSDITDDIDYSLTNISTLLNCVDQGVFDVTSSTLDITEIPSTGCGKTLNIEYTPSGNTTTFDGIIYNDLTKSGTSGAVGATETLKYWDNDYIASNSLTTGDEIRFTVAGQIDPTALGTDTVTIELYNTFTASVIDSTSYSSWLGSPGKLSSFVFNGVISLASLTNGRYTLMLDTNNADNSQFSICNNSSMKSYDVSTYNFSYLRIAVKFLTTSGASSGNNYVHKLMVEVRKKI